MRRLAAAIDLDEADEKVGNVDGDPTVHPSQPFDTPKKIAALERPPCVQQRHPLVINHIAVLIPRVLLVRGLERKGGVDEIEIDEVELEFLETGLEGGFDAFRTMIVVPELRSDKHFLPFDFPGLEH